MHAIGYWLLSLFCGPSIVFISRSYRASICLCRSKGDYGAMLAARVCVSCAVAPLVLVFELCFFHGDECRCSAHMWGNDAKAT